MKKRTVLITGATSGIGKMTALELAKMNYSVLVHGRNESKAKKIVKEIKQDSGNTNVDYLVADLFSIKSIKNMVNHFNKKYNCLDILINNAGAVLDDQRRENSDGIETTMQLNVIAPFLLTKLLMPKIIKSDDGRIINMSSGTYRMAKPDMNDLNLKNEPSGQKRYGISKLFVIWNTQYLASILKNKGVNNVTVNVSHPGAVATNFGQDSDNGFINNTIYKLASKFKFMSSIKKGAQTNIYLASSNEIKDFSGKFFNNKKKIIKPKDKEFSYKREMLLWKYCESITKSKF